MKALPLSLKFAAWLEGATLLLLVLVAVPLKYLGADPALVRLLGPVHGIAFLVYLYLVGKASARGVPGWRQCLRFVGASFLPGGTLWVVGRYRK